MGVAFQQQKKTKTNEAIAERRKEHEDTLSGLYYERVTINCHARRPL
jgi:hypothetical protein